MSLSGGDLVSFRDFHSSRFVVALLAIVACVVGDVARAGTLPFERSPFGVIAPNKTRPEAYAAPDYFDAVNMGYKWGRAGQLFLEWATVEKVFTDPPTYDWTSTDAEILGWPNGTFQIPGIAAPPVINKLANIHVNNFFTEDKAGDRRCAGSYLPCPTATLEPSQPRTDLERFLSFVEAAVERYDGDGIDDLPGMGPPITHFQIENEPNVLLRGDFALLHAATYQRVKRASPEAVVLLAGATNLSGPTNNHNWATEVGTRFVPILNELAGQYVDAVDVHWYGVAEEGYRYVDGTSTDVLDFVRNAMDNAGFPSSTKIWITELGSTSGWPLGAPRTEAQQAQDYIKKVVYGLSRGVSKVFTGGPMEGFLLRQEFFDYSGVIYDGEFGDPFPLGTKKLGYYSYKKLIEKLEGGDLNNITTIRDGTGTDWLYLFSVRRLGTTIYVAWWDFFSDPTYVQGASKPLVFDTYHPAVRATELVPDAPNGAAISSYETAPFQEVVHLIGSNGAVAVDLRESPVVIERFTLDPCGNKGRLRARTRPEINRDALSLSGDIVLPQPIQAADLDPTGVGAELAIEDKDGNLALRVTIPGGEFDGDKGWKGRVTSRGAKWTYKARAEDAVNGVRRLSIYYRTSTGVFRFKISGSRGTYPLTLQGSPYTIKFVPGTATDESFSACAGVLVPGCTARVSTSGAASLRCG